MTSAVVSNIDEIRELTIDELDEAGGGLTTGQYVVIGVLCLAFFGGGLAIGAVLA